MKNQPVSFKFLVAVFLYLPTTALFPAYLYYPVGLLLLPLILLKVDVKFKIILMGIISSLIISLVAYFLIGGSIDYVGNFLPVQVGLIFSLIIGCYLRDNKVI